MVERFSVPVIAGNDLNAVTRWIRDASTTLNEYFRQTATIGAYFNFQGQSPSIPSGQANALEVVFTSPFVGKGTFVLTVIGAQGGVTVALNGVTLATLSNADTTSEIIYQVSAPNLINGLNSLTFWDTAGDTAVLIRIEAWRLFTKGAEFTIRVSGDYQVTGLYDHEIVIATGTEAQTITMPPLVLDQRVTVIREGTGLPTIDGNGTNITGESTQELPTIYDVANMFGGVTEWLLRE